MDLERARVRIMTTKKTYTPAEKRRAVGLARRTSLREAGAKLGIPFSSIYYWATTTGIELAPPRVRPDEPDNIAEIMEHVAANGVKSAAEKYEYSRVTIQAWAGARGVQSPYAHKRNRKNG